MDVEKALSNSYFEPENDSDVLIFTKHQLSLRFI